MTTRSTSARPANIDERTELAFATQTFVEAFRRWSKGLAEASGARLSRLRLMNRLACEGPQKMADLADWLDVTPRNVTALVDVLESDGLVRRVPHGVDRRVTLIELTDEAPDAAQLFAAHQAAIAELFSVLSQSEQNEYLRLTRKLEERLAATTRGGAQA